MEQLQIPVSSTEYYTPYHGHEPRQLGIVHDTLRRQHRSVAFLAGDSSLDNKFWFDESAPAINGYERVFSPPRMKADVCYWLNHEAVRRGQPDLCCLNTAVEASSLSNRAFGGLLPQDEFIRDHITEDDYLIVSVGGNDIALMPTLLTVVNLLLLTWCVPSGCLERCACACPPNLRLDLGCFCCGLEGCLSGFLCGWPPGLGYFVDLFKNKVQNYVERLVAKRKPRKVIVCTIYYPDEARTGSWADCSLACMCYDCAPWRLQTAIKTIYRLATRRISIPGTEVVAVPLFAALDGRQSGDYRERVEPGPEGGRKMAALLMDAILSPSCAASGAGSSSGEGEPVD